MHSIPKCGLWSFEGKAIFCHRYLSRVTAAIAFSGRLLALGVDDPNTSAELKSLSLEELSAVKVDTVVGASKHEQKISDAPANVTILTAEEIKLYGWRTLGEALRSVAGLYVTYDRGYAFLGWRGVNRPGDFGGRTLINIDGHRLNDPIFDTAAMDTDFLLDLALIEKIEVIRGPGSSLYGNNAFFGVINIVTRRGREVNGAELTGSYGTFDTYTGRATYGNRFTNGVELLVSGTLYGSAGNPSLYYPEFASVDHGIAHNMDDGWSRSMFTSLSWKDISIEGGYVDRMKRWPTAPYSSSTTLVVFNDPTFHSIDERAFGDLKFHHRFENEVELTARAYYDHYRYDGWYPYNYSPSNPLNPTTVNEDYARSQSVGVELQASRKFMEKHGLTAGVELRSDFQLDQINRDVTPPQMYNNSHERRHWFGVFAQDEFKVSTNLLLNAGVRYDYAGSFGGTVNPRGGLIFHPWRPSTIKLLYGQAFRGPNAYEEFYRGAAYQSNLKLKPETVRSYELVYEHQFNREWRGSTSVFYNDIKDLINLADQAGNYVFANSGSATVEGLETELDAHWAGGLQGSVSYAFAHATDHATGQRLNNSPEHLAKLNLAVPVWRQKVFASAELQAMSRRTTVQGGTVGAYWVVNATLLSREIVKGLEVSASVYNLFDQHYSDPVSTDFTQSAVQQDGRTFRVKATWHF